MLLSFLFYILAARVFAPRGFGVVRYTIALSEIAFGALQVLSTSWARARRCPRRRSAHGSGPRHQRRGCRGPGWFRVPAALSRSARATGTAHLWGLLVVFTGLAAFTLYWSVAEAWVKSAAWRSST